jgi:sulfite exporter TauE/SafE
MPEVLIAGFMLGLVSSLHCVGMCGPIALALPVYSFSGWDRYIRIAAYHTGRIVTYSSLGFLFGWFGRGLHFAGLQQWLSVISGSLILFFVLQEYVFRQATQPFLLNKFRSFAQSGMGKLLKGKLPYQLLLLGMINGLLPCGMLYIALAGTLSTHTVFYSTGFMVLYGLGTVPAMLALSVAGGFASADFRFYIRKATPYLMASVAILLILRGLNLGIPFISPVLPTAQNEAVICH